MKNSYYGKRQHRHFKQEIEFIFIRPEESGNPRSSPAEGCSQEDKSHDHHGCDVVPIEEVVGVPVEPTTAQEATAIPAGPLPEPSPAEAAPGCAQRHYPRCIIKLHNTISPGN
jgi:hypothetical protein